jgi:hypothetical protein
MNIHKLSGIRTRNPSNKAAADLQHTATGIGQILFQQVVLFHGFIFSTLHYIRMLSKPKWEN